MSTVIVSIPEPFNTLGQLGIGGAVVAFFIWVLAKRILRVGPEVDAMMAEKDRQIAYRDKRIEEVEGERDEYKDQVGARQKVVDQAIELAGLLKEFSRHSMP